MLGAETFALLSNLAEDLERLIIVEQDAPTAARKINARGSTPKKAALDMNATLSVGIQDRDVLGFSIQSLFTLAITAKTSSSELGAQVRTIAPEAVHVLARNSRCEL
jgi:hypothetical protein